MGPVNPPWAAIGGAVGGTITLIALLACCLFWCYRKRTNRARDLENTTADTSETSDMKDDVVLSPSNAVSTPERTEFVNIANLEEADLSPQVAATGEDRLSELSPQEQALMHVISLSRLPLPTLLTHSY